MFQEKLEGLREAQHRVTRDDEGGHLLAAVVYQLALVGRRVGRRDGRRRVVGARGPAVVGGGHQLQGRVVHQATAEAVEQPQARGRQRWHA